MPGLDWLTAQPLAHRGLHDAAGGAIENTASALRAAIAAGYGIEIDLQVTADGEAVVHHDDVLGRLTDGSGRLASMTAAALKAVPFKATADRIITLAEACDIVAGCVTLLIEIKSHFDGDRRLVARVAQVLTGYAGPVAAMSFDPDMVLAAWELAAGLPRGIVAEHGYRDPEWNRFSPTAKRSMAYLLHAYRTRPHFVAYALRDLPALAPLAARTLLGLPLLTWTVRSEQDRVRAVRYADQMIFEGIRP